MLQSFMKKSCICLMVAYAVALPTPVSAQRLLDWQATGSGTMMSGTPFTMKNLSDKETLKYGSRTWGINLVWDKNTSLNNITVEKQSGSGAVTYGEPVAVRVKGGGYLKYAKRPVGINLTWSTTPVYEWRLGGGNPGESVSLNSPFALLNDVEHDAMIYGSRPAGINLVWLKDYGKSTLSRVLNNAYGYAKPLAAKYLQQYF